MRQFEDEVGLAPGFIEETPFCLQAAIERCARQGLQQIDERKEIEGPRNRARNVEGSIQ